MAESSSQSAEFTADGSRSHIGAIFTVCTASLPGDGIGKPVTPIAQQGFDSMANPRWINHSATVFLNVSREYIGYPCFRWITGAGWRSPFSIKDEPSERLFCAIAVAKLVARDPSETRIADELST